MIGPRRCGTNLALPHALQSDVSYLSCASFIPQPRAFRIHRVLKGEVTIGWSASFLTQMQNNSYFGNLLVGTILDCVARPDALSQVAALADRALAREGADLVITNQSLKLMEGSLLACRFSVGSLYIPGGALACPRASTLEEASGRWNCPYYSR